LLNQRLKVLVLVLGRGSHAPRDSTDGHEPEEVQVGAVVDD
jgi:hypothetical protein